MGRRADHGKPPRKTRPCAFDLAAVSPSDGQLSPKFPIAQGRNRELFDFCPPLPLFQSKKSHNANGLCGNSLRLGTGNVLVVIREYMACSRSGRGNFEDGTRQSARIYWALICGIVPAATIEMRAPGSLKNLPASRAPPYSRLAGCRSTVMFYIIPLSRHWWVRDLCFSP